MLLPASVDSISVAALVCLLCALFYRMQWVDTARSKKNDTVQTIDDEEAATEPAPAREEPRPSATASAPAPTGPAATHKAPATPLPSSKFFGGAGGMGTFPLPSKVAAVSSKASSAEVTCSAFPVLDLVTP